MILDVEFGFNNIGTSPGTYFGWLNIGIFYIKDKWKFNFQLDFERKDFTLNSIITSSYIMY